MKAVDIIIIALSVTVVVAVAVGGYIRKKRLKKSGCRATCVGCPYAEACRSGEGNGKNV